MDASAFVTKDQWEDILSKNLCDEVDIRYSRISGRTFSLRTSVMRWTSGIAGSVGGHSL